MSPATGHTRSAAAVARRHLRFGLWVLLISFVLLYWGFVHHLPFMGGPEGRVVLAEVRTAANVNKRTPVRVGGIDVGTIEKVVASGAGHTSTIAMRLKDDDVDLRSDASADVRFRTLLGGSMYIDLHPGSASAPPLGNRTIPLARTTAQVDWDEFNGIFAEPVPEAQRKIIKGFADALESPKPLRRLLRDAPPAFGSFGRSASASRGRDDGELTELIRNANRVLRGFAADGYALGDTISGAQRTVTSMARARSALSDTLESAPAALRSARTAMTRFDRTLSALDPLAEELLPGLREVEPSARRMRPAMASLEGLLGEAEPLLESAPPALESLRDAARAGLPMIDALKPLTDRLNGRFLPFLNTYNPKIRLKVYEMFGPFMSVHNDSQKGFDDNGFFLRTVAQQSPYSVLLPCPAGDSVQDPTCLTLVRVYKRLMKGGRP